MHDKKRYIVGVVIVGVLLISALVWTFWPWQEYGDLEMSPNYDVAENIMMYPESQIFAEALYNIGYTTFLQGEGPYTVFLPTDKAFRNLPEETRAYLGSVNHGGDIRQVLQYHVVKGKYLYGDLKPGMKLKTINGEELSFSQKEGYLVIDGYAYVEISDLESTNGVIHVITNYLLPPSIRK